MGQKYALIIGNSEYQDPNFARLRKPAADAEALATTLSKPEIGRFNDVQSLINKDASVVRVAIARLFDRKKPDDLVLAYFSGHGIRDADGHLYLAMSDSQLDLLSATAIPASFITEQIDRSRSHRIVLILDCCHSGAFTSGSKAPLNESIGTAPAFEGTGYGRVVLTASDSTQYAWEGENLKGSAPESLFTHHLVQGIETGEADINRDGQITIDELYDYVYERVIKERPNQTPGKWTYKQQGEVVVAHNPRAVATTLELSQDLRQLIESSIASARETAVRELSLLLRTTNRGIALAATQALEKLREDDSKTVSAAAVAALESFVRAERQPHEQEKAKAEPLTKAQAVAQRKAQEPGEQLSHERKSHLYILGGGGLAICMFLLIAIYFKVNPFHSSAHEVNRKGQPPVSPLSGISPSPSRPSIPSVSARRPTTMATPAWNQPSSNSSRAQEAVRETTSNTRIPSPISEDEREPRHGTIAPRESRASRPSLAMSTSGILHVRSARKPTSTSSQAAPNASHNQVAVRTTNSSIARASLTPSSNAESSEAARTQVAIDDIGDSLEKSDAELLMKRFERFGYKPKLIPAGTEPNRFKLEFGPYSPADAIRARDDLLRHWHDLTFHLIVNSSAGPLMDQTTADSALETIQHLGARVRRVPVLVDGQTKYQVEIGPFVTEQETMNAGTLLGQKYSDSLNCPWGNCDWQYTWRGSPPKLLCNESNSYCKPDG
jgi:uncharacterized caspase-like protein